jgi:signal peptide peptidase SppA
VHGAIVQRASADRHLRRRHVDAADQQRARDANDDDSVAQILLDIDSPGGSVYGVQELAAEIAASRKPVVAIANSLAASAAYWLGSAASEFHVTPGGEVGSIGVWMAHEDWSKAVADAGVNVTLIAAGQYKVEGNPYEPLSADARKFLQSRVDDYYQTFTRAVAKGRKVGVDAVRGGMGQGRVLGADQAKAEGMVDSIATFDQVVAGMQRNIKNSAPRASRLAAAQREIDILA